MPDTSTTHRGTLYVVSTPIGNLNDVTLRALEVLKSVDYIVCEDTRITIKLLNRYEIRKTLVSFHSKSKGTALDRIVGDILQGKDIVYVTDSGTPTVSDPGCKLIERVIEGGGEIVPVPGPSAVHSALIASGFSFSEYTFCGFLSSKGSRRRRRLNELKNVKSVLVFFESPHRIMSFLEDLRDIFYDVKGCIAKEMTKKFEKYYRGEIKVLIDMLNRDGVKGEYTVIVDNRGG